MSVMNRIAPRRREAGLTMIELMIAVTVALVLLAALAAMYGTNVKARNEIERSHRQIENGRYAVQLLRDDLQLAGFWGEYDMRGYTLIGTVPPSIPAVPDVCVTHLDGPADLPGDGIAADRDADGDVDGLDYLMTVAPVHVQGFDDVAAGTLPSCLAGQGVREGTDVVVVRRLLTCAAGDTDCPFSEGAPYFQASQCQDQIDAGLTAIPPAYFGNLYQLRTDATGVAGFTRQTRLCDSTQTTPVRRWVTHIYFVSNNNVGSDGIPTLKRRELLADGWTTVSLVEGIEDIQYEYGQGAAMPTTVAEWLNTTTVRAFLLSRSIQPQTGYQDVNTYQLGPDKAIAAPNDAYKRQVFETLIQLRNPAARLQ